MLSRDYCQRLDTRDLFGTTRNVLESQSEPVESSTSIYRGVLHGRNPITTFDGSVFSKHRETCSQKWRSEQGHTIPTPRFARKSSTWNLPSHAEGMFPHNYMVDQRRLQISELHFDKFPTPSTFLVLEDKVLVLVHPRKQCCGSKKSRWSIQWTISCRRAQFRNIISRISRCWTRRLPQHWTRSSTVPSSRRRSV